tara:strand:- start:836 stop:952 length:117 start_codon:yes stop_codon:yes gene_type:complete
MNKWNRRDKKREKENSYRFKEDITFKKNKKKVKKYKKK